MVPFTACARQNSPVALMGAIIFLRCVWEMNYLLDTWRGNVLNYTKKIEASGLSWEFLKVPINGSRKSTFPRALKPRKENGTNL